MRRLEKTVITGAAALMLMIGQATADDDPPSFPTDDCDEYGCTDCKYVSETEVECFELTYLELGLILGATKGDGFTATPSSAEPTKPMIPGRPYATGLFKALQTPMPEPVRPTRPNR